MIHTIFSSVIKLKANRTLNLFSDQSNNDPWSEAWWSHLNKKVKLPQKGRELWLKSSCVEEANSCVASGGFSWHSTCTHQPSKGLWGSVIQWFAQTLGKSERTKCLWQWIVPLSSCYFANKPLPLAKPLPWKKNDVIQESLFYFKY